MPAELASGRALAFVEAHGVVLESGRGPVPSLAQAIAGGRIRGSWWAHPKRGEIFVATRAVRDSADVVVCRLIGGKITYVHRRLWPVLVRLAHLIDNRRLGAIREEHGASGAHRLVTVAYPSWVTPDVRAAAEALPESDALELSAAWVGSTRRTSVRPTGAGKPTAPATERKTAKASAKRKRPG